MREMLPCVFVEYLLNNLVINKLTVEIFKIERNCPKEYKKTVSCLQDYPKRLTIMHRYLKEIFTSEVYEIHFLCTR